MELIQKTKYQVRNWLAADEGKPKTIKEGKEVARISLKLQPKAAAALARLTRDHLGKQVERRGWRGCDDA